MSQEFNPPKDPALHAIWVIHNWTRRPLGNSETYEDVVRKVHLLAEETFTQLHTKRTT